MDNFSKYASSYDAHTGVQNEVADMLTKRLPEDGVTKILEIGCGTGNYTARLKDIFKNACIKAIDISGPMVSLARQKLSDERISFEVADIEKFEMDEGCDLVTSNAVFHWLTDLDGAIRRSERSLAQNGKLLFSAFGPKTFPELKVSLGEVSGGDVSLPPDWFPKKDRIEDSLREYFKRFSVTERLVRESHASLRELVTKIKYSGTRGRGSGLRRVWSPELLKRIEDRYVDRFGSIETTYQVFFCEGWK